MNARNKVEIAINTLPFWSRFTLTTDLRYDGVDALRTQFSAGFELPVFDYRKGEQNVAALGGALATERDTILTTASQTRGGGMYTIEGISITKDGPAYVRSGERGKNGIIHTLWPPASMQPANGVGPLTLTQADFQNLDSLMWTILGKFFKMDVKIDGTKRTLEMGPVPFYPGIGGPSGPLDTTNGGVWNGNYMRIREGIQWNPAGAVDSNLTVKLVAAYDCVTPTWTAPDILAPDGEPIVGGIPTAIGREWTQGYILNFHGYEQSPLSNVS